jgi:transcriptional regulator with GAF, ATPase, and Fis domain
LRIDEPTLAITEHCVEPRTTSPSGGRTTGPFEVVASVAPSQGESLDFRDVFGRVAEVAQDAFAFDRMCVLRLEGEEHLRVYSVTTPRSLGDPRDGVEGRLISMADFSPRFLPHLPVDRIDTERDLVPAYAWDRETLDAGIRSIIHAVLRSEGRILGVLAFSSRQKGAFTSHHETVVLALGNLVAVALEHERLWSSIRERRRRSDALDALLPTLARALDMREAFERISDATRHVIPHDVLTLGVFSTDLRTVRVYTMADGQSREFPPLPVLNELRMTDRDSLIVRDIVVGDRARGIAHFLPLSPNGQEGAWSEARLDPVRMNMLTSLGLRSALGVPLHAEGKLAGQIMFYSRQTHRYQPDDSDLARRIAAHVGLALAYQRLAEEQRRSTDARRRAERLAVRVETLTREIEALREPRQIVGESVAWREVLRQATQVAATSTTVLLLGESGTGKEVVARFLHRVSPRADGPYVALNCAALPDQLLEAELFGYEKGAFTGAVRAKAGQIERAAGGILFLDEVGEMSASLQAKLLRVLEEREYQRLGGSELLKADVRVVSATNRDLRAAVEHGTFRDDLYYRLSVFDIRLPALRERREDILPLSRLFLGEIGHSFGRPPAGLTREAQELLLQYHWPGNVRELRNMLERAAILTDGGRIGVEHLSLSGPRPARRAGAADRESERGNDAFGGRLASMADLRSRERHMIEAALEAARHNKSLAARRLGLTRKQLYGRLRRYGLS